MAAVPSHFEGLASAYFFVQSRVTFFTRSWQASFTRVISCADILTAIALGTQVWSPALEGLAAVPSH